MCNCKCECCKQQEPDADDKLIIRLAEQVLELNKQYERLSVLRRKIYQL